MSLDKKIISEIERYHFINKYIFEQEVSPEAPLAPEAGGEAPLPATPTEPEVIDVEQDQDVTKIDNSGKSEEGDSGVEELDITDLVKSQEQIQTKQEEYFENLFGQISNLENKLKEMDTIVNKLNALENKIEKYREKTPQEKLELRTYDSYPFNQKLSDFFDDKKEEMEKTGKRDYVLTSDQVMDVRDNEIKDSFLPTDENIKY